MEKEWKKNTFLLCHAGNWLSSWGTCTAHRSSVNTNLMWSWDPEGYADDCFWNEIGLSPANESTQQIPRSMCQRLASFKKQMKCSWLVLAFLLESYSVWHCFRKILWNEDSDLKKHLLHALMPWNLLKINVIIKISCRLNKNLMALNTKILRCHFSYRYAKAI